MSATKLSAVKYIARVGIFTSLGLVLSFVESMIPATGVVPGMKIGLANIVTMAALFLTGPVFAVFVGLLRSLLSAVFSGGLTMFLYSGAGTVLCILAMYITSQMFKKSVSVIGISMIGALFFNIGQICIAAISVSNIYMFSYLPILTVVSTFCGVLTGYITKKILEAEYVKF